VFNPNHNFPRGILSSWVGDSVEPDIPRNILSTLVAWIKGSTPGSLDDRLGRHCDRKVGGRNLGGAELPTLNDRRIGLDLVVVIAPSVVGSPVYGITRDRVQGDTLGASAGACTPQVIVDLVLPSRDRGQIPAFRLCICCSCGKKDASHKGN